MELVHRNTGLEPGVGCPGRAPGGQPGTSCVPRVCPYRVSRARYQALGEDPVCRSALSGVSLHFPSPLSLSSSLACVFPSLLLVPSPFLLSSLF